MKRLITLHTLLALTLIGACKKADDAADKPPAMPPAAPTAAEPARLAGGRTSSYPPTTQPGRILVGDLLRVDVSDLAGPGVESVFPVQVPADGTLLLPILAKPVAVAGMTTWAAEQAITKAYRAENLIQNAVVGVRRLRIAGTGGPPVGSLGNYDLVRIAIGELKSPGDMIVLIRRVDGEGMVSLPYIGRQKLAGLTDHQAAMAIAAAYHSQNIIQAAPVLILRLEAAPPDAGKVDLPDGPIEPVPEMLRWLYESLETQPVRAPGK